MQVHMKQKCVIGFLCTEKNGTQWYSLMLAECFWRQNSGWKHSEVVSVASTGGRDMKDKTHFTHSCHIMNWRVSWSTHPCELANYDHGTLYWVEYKLECIGNVGGNIGILQSLCQVGFINAHTKTKRTLFACFSEPTEPMQRWHLPELYHYWWLDVELVL